MNSEIDYKTVRDHFMRNGYSVTESRIKSIKYEHKSIKYHDRVGHPSERNSEIVMAIFELGKGSFAICTENNGWDLEHLPIFTGTSGDDVVTRVEYEDNGKTSAPPILVSG